MTGKKLVTSVTVSETAADGSVSSTSYDAGDTPTAAHAKLITNPAAFDLDEWAKDSLAKPPKGVEQPNMAAVPPPDTGDEG
jgi:hypothetical protein